jgi:hypothetical protein
MTLKFIFIGEWDIYIYIHTHIYTIVVGKSEKYLGDTDVEGRIISKLTPNKTSVAGTVSRRIWEDNIKMDFREVVWEGMDWIDLAQDRDR